MAQYCTGWLSGRDVRAEPRAVAESGAGRAEAIQLLSRAGFCTCLCFHVMFHPFRDKQPSQPSWWKAGRAVGRAGCGNVPWLEGKREGEKPCSTISRLSEWCQEAVKGSAELSVLTGRMELGGHGICLQKKSGLPVMTVWRKAGIA